MRAWSALAGGAWSWRRPPSGTVPVTITANCPEITGSMSGLHVNMRPADEDGSVTASNEANEFEPIVSVDGLPAFLRVVYGGVPAYFCVSSAIVDIDAPVLGNFYDVKVHFLAAVPLVMFVTSVFRDVMWRPQELGACLIIDDPLLKFRYGRCDFRRLRDLMRQHHFTTNIAFIPWNWRRTTRQAGDFFGSESDCFSISVHGCDHVAAEFGETSVEIIDHAARLAQARMGKHRARTSIPHDPIMVFPQGVFSSTCPAVLKRNGFMAAINTEISPTDGGGAGTLICDVWDVAITRYGSFPIYTRRYASHGIENFAFDLLLGKPCFIVAHHDFFEDHGAGIVDLVTRLSALTRGGLNWRTPREVIRRAYRQRFVDGCQEIQMYASELTIPTSPVDNHGILVRKHEKDAASVTGVTLGANELAWSIADAFLELSVRKLAVSQGVLSVRYAQFSEQPLRKRSMHYEMAVGLRRLLSEFRDEYAHKLVFRKAS